MHDYSVNSNFVPSFIYSDNVKCINNENVFCKNVLNNSQCVSMHSNYHDDVILSHDNSVFKCNTNIGCCSNAICECDVHVLNGNDKLDKNDIVYKRDTGDKHEFSNDTRENSDNCEDNDFSGNSETCEDNYFSGISDTCEENDISGNSDSRGDSNFSGNSDKCEDNNFSEKRIIPSFIT